MNKNMEQMISRDLGMGIQQIRRMSWEKLDKIRGKDWKNHFDLKICLLLVEI